MIVAPRRSPQQLFDVTNFDQRLAITQGQIR